MMTFRALKLSICFIAGFILSGAFSAYAQTVTLENTSWDIDVVTYSITSGDIANSTANMTFSDGQLSVGGWTMDLLPGLYQEQPKKKSIQFTATLTKPMLRSTLVYEFQGAAVVGQGIAGVIKNETSGMYYFFWGKPILP